MQKHVGLFNPHLYETEVRALLELPIAAKVDTFEDDGEIFLKHADRATMLPGVNLTQLSPEQKVAALHKFNAESVRLRLQNDPRAMPHLRSGLSDQPEAHGRNREGSFQ